MGELLSADTPRKFQMKGDVYREEVNKSDVVNQGGYDYLLRGSCSTHRSDLTLPRVRGGTDECVSRHQLTVTESDPAPRIPAEQRYIGAER